MTGAGELRERVQLQDPPGVDDGAGGQTGDWTDVGVPIAAKVVAFGGDEAVIAGIELGVTRFRVKLRRREIATGRRLVWRGLALDIRAVLPDPGRQFVVLVCDGVLL